MSSEIYTLLKNSPMVAGVASRDAILISIRDTIARNMGIVTLFNSAFAVMIIFGVVYNSGRIMLSKRARDLASLRVLGYRRSDNTGDCDCDILYVASAGNPS